MMVWNFPLSLYIPGQPAGSRWQHHDTQAGVEQTNKKSLLNKIGLWNKVGQEMCSFR